MLQSTLEIAAVVSSAIFGVLLAKRKGLDFVGVFSVACLVALGGGSLRDLLLDRHPVFWIEQPGYPIAVFILALVGSAVRSVPAATERFLSVPDALALGFFSILGASYAHQADTSLFVASLLGVVTGTFGGVMADVVCNEIPRLFRPAPLYATCSFAGSWVFLLLPMLGVPSDAAASAGVAMVVASRLAAVRWGLQLPVR